MSRELGMYAEEIMLWAEQFARSGDGCETVYAALRRFGESVPRAKQLVEESLQNGLLQIMVANRSYDGYAHFRNTVIRAAINGLIGDYRKRRGLRTLTNEQNLPALTRREDGDIDEILEGLTDPERDWVMKRVFDGVTLHDLARECGMSVSTAHKTWHLILRKLRATCE